MVILLPLLVAGCVRSRQDSQSFGDGQRLAIMALVEMVNVIAKQSGASRFSSVCVISTRQVFREVRSATSDIPIRLRPSTRRGAGLEEPRLEVRTVGSSWKIVQNGLLSRIKNPLGRFHKYAQLCKG